MRCLMNDLQPSYKIKMKYSKDEFFLTDENSIYNLRLGKRIGNLNNLFQEVIEVKDYKNNLVAIDKFGTLELYDPIRHDEKIISIRLRNNLYSYSELIYELNKNGYEGYKINNVDYVKINNTKLKENDKTVKTYRGILLSGNDIQITITRYEVRKELCLYGYDVSSNILF